MTRRSFPLWSKSCHLRRNKIAMLADFALGKVNQEDERQLKCTSFLLEGPFETDPGSMIAAPLLRPRKYMAALTIKAQMAGWRRGFNDASEVEIDLGRLAEEWEAVAFRLQEG